MAIIRCPYCHAIIDETDKYCNNCGTQLLFPDDDSIEEEIPGEKIIDADTEEKDYELDEASKTDEPLPGDEYERETAGTGELTSVLNSDVETRVIEEILEEEMTEEEAAAGPHETTEKVLLVDEIAASEKEEDLEKEKEAAEDRAAREKTTPTTELFDEDIVVTEVKAVDAETASVKDEGTQNLGESQTHEVSETLPGVGYAVAEEAAPPESPLDSEKKEPAEEEGRDQVPQETGYTDVGSAPAEAIPAREEDVAAPVAPTEAPPATTPTAEPTIEPIPEMKPEPTAEPTSEMKAEPTADPAAVPAESLTFDTSELEGIGDTIDLSKARLDKVMDEMADHDTGAAPEPEPERPAQEKTGTLPPWADRMKGAPSMINEDKAGDETRKFEDAQKSLLAKDSAAEENWPDGTKDEIAEEMEEEEEIFPKRRDSDSGLGYPERLTQAALPFEAGRERETAEGLSAASGGEAAAAEEPGPAVVPAAPAELSPAARAVPDVRLGRDDTVPPSDAAWEEEEETQKPPFSLAYFLKSKVFDCLFIGFVWLIALWLAAQSMSATLFDILSLAPWSAALLYAALVLLYFFLFKFFLGETLGDRLFKERE